MNSGCTWPDRYTLLARFLVQWNMMAGYSAGRLDVDRVNSPGSNILASTCGLARNAGYTDYLVFWLFIVGEKTTATNEHAIVAGVAPFDAYVVLKFTSLAGHANNNVARADGTAMQQADTSPADFSRHGRNGISARCLDFCRNRELQTFIGADITNV